MDRKPVFMVVFLALCLFLSQAVFASGNEYPTEKRAFDPEVETYTLEEAFWLQPTVFATEVLEFTQVYMYPEDAVEFFLEAAQYTDEEIEDLFIIFQVFFQQEIAGYVKFRDSCDVQAYLRELGEEDYFDPGMSYILDYYFESPENIAAIYPAGIGRADAYETYRRAALRLAAYCVKNNGNTPCFDMLSEYLEQVYAYYQAEFDAAMEEEALYSESYAVYETELTEY